MPAGEPKEFDAFLSYNSIDRLAVAELAERLRGRHLRVYYEQRELLPGRSFQDTLAEALVKSRTCVVFVGPNGEGPWQKEEIQVAIDLRVRDDSYHVIPVLLPGRERPRRGVLAFEDCNFQEAWTHFLNAAVLMPRPPEAVAMPVKIPVIP
jgi:hypothetical protein